nr:oligosaccharide flippase family protein [Prevotella amnii]
MIANFFHQVELISLSRFLFVSLIFSALGTAHTAYLFKNMIVRETTILRILSLIFSGIISIILAFKGYAYWSLAWQQFLFIAIMSIGRFFITPCIHLLK